MSYAYMDHADWDNCDLSKLWILCHRLMVRVEINPCTPRHLKLEFWQRKTREGDISRRLPDCEEMIKLVDSEFFEGYEDFNNGRS
jgi:hypothetical protein